MNKKIQVYFAKILVEAVAEPKQYPTGLAITASKKRFREFYTSRKLINLALDDGWRLVEHGDKPPTIYNSNQTQSLSLSISHSNDWAAIAIAPSSCRLGLDIELIRENWSRDKANMFCSAQEVDKGLALSDVDANVFFTKIWTQKEAFFKATQQPFAAKNLEHDNRITSAELTESYVYSIYSDPPLAIETTVIDLSTDEAFVEGH